MQIDYSHIKNILTEIREMPSFTFNVEPLAEKLEIDNPAGLDKLVGHISLLKDFGILEEVSSDLFRMTAKGYDILDILNNNSALGLIRGYEKAFTISFEIGKKALCY